MSAERGPRAAGRTRRRLHAVVAGCAAGAAIVAGSSAAQASPALTVSYVRTLGGPGHATMYPSGMEIAPSGDIVIADTGNNQIAEYSADGLSLLWRVGSSGRGALQFQQPRDAGVDSAGNVYVADNANGRIDKLSPGGGWITSWKSNPSGAGAPIGVTVSQVGGSDRVYVADGNHSQVNVFGTTGTVLGAITSNGACTLNRMRDAVADSQGNVYVANYEADDILVFDAAGHCLNHWGSKGSGTDQFKNPYGITLGYDPRLAGASGVANAIWVADSNNDRLVEFTLAGALSGTPTQVATVAGPGPNSSPGTFTQLRRVAVARDGSGAVWGADLWGNRVERFTRGSGGYAYAESVGVGGTQGGAGIAPPLAPGSIYNEVRGIAFDPAGDVLTMDTVNQRMVQLSHDGSTVQRACGQRGFTSGGSFNWPRGVAVDPGTGDIWIADTKQSDLQVLTSSCGFVKKLAGRVGTALNELDWPYSITVRTSDRTVWVADTKNARVVAYSAASMAPIAAFGTRGSGAGQFGSPAGIAVDPSTGHILVADSLDRRIAVLGAGSGATGIQWLGTVTDTTTALRSPYGVAMDGSGHIAVADNVLNRVAILDPSGSELAAVTSANGMTLAGPEDVAFGADGLLYVADTYHDRVVVLSV